jgi:hypothetical protein
MNNKFDELTRKMAQSVTRRGALKKFGLGVAGIALAALGLPNKAQAFQCNCKKANYGCDKPNSPPNCITMCFSMCIY